MSNEVYVTSDGERKADARPHVCNFYCRTAEGIHCHTLYAIDELTEDTVAIIAGGVRCDVIEWRAAPEVPPVDPSDPEGGVFPYRYLVWSRP